MFDRVPVATGFVVATLMMGFVTQAKATGWLEVTFKAPTGLNRQYTRVYVGGTVDGNTSCYLESAGDCNNTITLVAGLDRIRYAMYPNNGGFASDEIAHMDFWYNFADLGGSMNNPVPYDVTIPISLVTFTASPNPGNGYQVYVLSSDNVGQYQDATRPKKHNSALGFYVGNATNTVANIKLLAGCYTVSFASPWNNTGTSGLRPITKYWTLKEPVCVDGINSYEVNSSAP